jgi:hypothetical protein
VPNNTSPSLTTPPSLLSRLRTLSSHASILAAPSHLSPLSTILSFLIMTHDDKAEWDESMSLSCYTQSIPDTCVPFEFVSCTSARMLMRALASLHAVSVCMCLCLCLFENALFAGGMPWHEQTHSSMSKHIPCVALGSSYTHSLCLSVALGS